MKKNETTLVMQNKRLFIILSVALLLLAIPMVSMLFTGEVIWSPFDFVVMGVLLVGTGLGCELVLRKVTNKTIRIIMLLVVLALLFLTWAELAVGIFGTPFAGN